MENVLYLWPFYLLFSEVCCCYYAFLEIEKPTIMAIGKLLFYAVSIPCTKPHWYTIWHCRTLRRGSHQCNPFCSVQLLWVAVVSKVRAASTWITMIRSLSGEKRTNKYEMEKWFSANWYVIEQNEHERTLWNVKELPGGSVSPPLCTDLNDCRWGKAVTMMCLEFQES